MYLCWTLGTRIEVFTVPADSGPSASVAGPPNSAVLVFRCTLSEDCTYAQPAAGFRVSHVPVLPLVSSLSLPSKRNDTNVEKRFKRHQRYNNNNNNNNNKLCSFFFEYWKRNLSEERG